MNKSLIIFYAILCLPIFILIVGITTILISKFKNEKTAPEVLNRLNILQNGSTDEPAPQRIENVGNSERTNNEDERVFHILADILQTMRDSQEIFYKRLVSDQLKFSEYIHTIINSTPPVELTRPQTSKQQSIRKNNVFEFSANRKHGCNEGIIKKDPFDSIPLNTKLELDRFCSSDFNL